MEVIGAPFDICGYRLGARLGAAAVRLAGLRATLEGLGQSVTDTGDVVGAAAPDSEETLKKYRELGVLKHYGALLENVSLLSERVANSIRGGEIPLVIGGDHSNSIGSVGGALQAYGDDLALVWIDAHADLNDYSSSPSGNVHGMSVRMLLGGQSGTSGQADSQWKSVQQMALGGRTLSPDRVGWIGLRDVDPGERDAIHKMPNCFKSTMSDIDRDGLMASLNGFDSFMKSNKAKKLWISFDVDCLDPVLAPGTGTAVRGGLSYREMHLLGEAFYNFFQNGNYDLAGLDIVEISPLFDSHNETAKVAVEWAASLFGKTILGKR